MLTINYTRVALAIISSSYLSAVYADCPSQTAFTGENINTLAKTGKVTLSGDTFSMLTAAETGNDYNKKLLSSAKALEGFLKVTNQNKNLFDPRVVSLSVPKNSYCAYNISVIMPGKRGGENFVIALRKAAGKENIANAAPKAQAK